MVGRNERGPGRNAVFLDTSALYALFSPPDEHHFVATAVYRRVTSERRDVVTTNFVLLELHSLITNRRRAALATAALFTIEAGDTFIVRVSEEDEANARDTLRKYTDKGFSLLDATSFAVMRRLKLDTALSFDRHFAQFGWTVLGA